jgi:GT2 family glycosyltransferase
MLSAIIPTRNRPDDLFKAVCSVCAQTRPPDELIIVDQSCDKRSRIQVELIMLKSLQIKLIYIHDANISGLVEAKHIGVGLAKGAIVCFLEDDVILEPDYLEQIEKGFDKHPEMIGCCGIISNTPPYLFGYEFVFHFFHLGIFQDQRVGIHRRTNGFEKGLVPSKMLSGGVSAWRQEVFSAIPFDIANGFHMLEDIDFSTRVAMYYGDRLYINPKARLEHWPSPLNREVLGSRQRRKLVEYIIYYKKRRDQQWATTSFIWLLLGLFFEAVLQALISGSFSVLRGFFAGVREGFARVVFQQNPSIY